MAQTTPDSDSHTSAGTSSGTAQGLDREFDSGVGPGLGLVAVGAVTAAVVSSLIGPVSMLVAAVVVGALIGNTPMLTPRTQPGMAFAAKRVLRVGVVLLGLRLSLGDVAALGGRGVIIVAVTVAVTFFGTQAIGRRVGLSPSLSLLIATGYSICGASAIAAVEGSCDADEEEVAAAIGLVTLFGSLAIFTLPTLASPLGLSGEQFGAWAGASVHDVAQVVATASNYQPGGGGGSARVDGAIPVASVVAVATVVKLTRVALLAPLVAGVNLNRRRSAVSETINKPTLLPLFVAGFLAMATVRSTGLAPDVLISSIRTVEGWVLAAALVGLGSGVRFSRLRSLGPRPFIVGLVAWILVASVSYLAISAI